MSAREAALVALAAALNVALGRLWYSRFLFAGLWNRADDGRQGLRRNPPWRVYGVGFFFSLIAAAAFKSWLGPNPPLAGALEQGALIGAPLVAASFALNYLFAHHKPTLMWIDGGYHAVQFLLFALIFGLTG